MDTDKHIELLDIENCCINDNGNPVFYFNDPNVRFGIIPNKILDIRGKVNSDESIIQM